MTKEEREQIRAKVVALMEDDTSKELLRQYTKALSRSKKIIERMYERYSVKGTLTYGEMTKYNRIQSVWDSITSELTDLTSVKEKSIKKLARDAYEYEYFHEAYEMDGILKEYSLRSDWMMLNRDQVEASIQNPLSGLTLNDRLKVHQEEIIRNAKGTITQGLIFGEDYFTIARKMKDLFEGDATKALRVARTECHRVQNEGKHAIELRAKEAGVKMDKEWVHSGDDLVRDEHKALGGQIADSEGYFHFQGLKALYPGGFGVAKLDINCRCRYRMILLKKNGERFRDNELVTGETFEQWASQHDMAPHSTLGDWAEKDRQAWNELQKQHPKVTPPIPEKKPFAITDVSKASYQEIDDYIDQHANDNKAIIKLMGMMVTGKTQINEASFEKGILASYAKGMNKLRRLLNITDKLPVNQLTSHHTGFIMQSFHQRAVSALNMMDSNYRERLRQVMDIKAMGIPVGDIKYCKLLEEFVKDIDAGLINTTHKYSNRITSLNRALKNDKWTIMQRTYNKNINTNDLLAHFSEAEPLKQLMEDIDRFNLSSGYAYTSMEYKTQAGRRFTPICISEYGNDGTLAEVELSAYKNYLSGFGNVPSLGDIIIHEYGHLLDGALCELDPDWEQWRLEYYHRHIKNHQPSEERSTRVQGYYYDRISRYAKYSEKEMVAEAFIDVLLNSDVTPYSKEVYERMFKNFSVDKLIKNLNNIAPDPIKIIGIDRFKRKK